MRKLLLGIAIAIVALLLLWDGWAAYRDELTPQNAGDWWTAISAVATALSAFLTLFAVIYAVRATWHAAESVRVEPTPIVTLGRRDNGRVLIRNMGRGLALNVLMTNEDGELVKL